jgi:hypothetical protein
MTIVAPHIRKHLSADALFRVVHTGFASLAHTQHFNHEPHTA